jgi:hypothetical protein
MATPGSQGTPSAAPTSGRAPIQHAAVAFGVVFLLVGILGFIPGITTNYEMLDFAGHHSGAKLLNVFEVSILHNIVHLLFGVLALALSGTFNGARGFLIGGGGIYLALWLYGIIVDRESSANFVPVNRADNWLHLALAVGMLATAALLGRVRSPGTQRV